MGNNPNAIEKNTWTFESPRLFSWINMSAKRYFYLAKTMYMEWNGIECRTPEREVWGSKPTAAVLCPWGRHFTPRKYWLITQEAVAPSRHDWKIVDWDVKPQHKQANKFQFVYTHHPYWLLHLFTTLLTLT